MIGLLSASVEIPLEYSFGLIINFVFLVWLGTQTGIISPSKLRMKIIGPHNHKKKEGSNSNSARTSPSKLEDSEFVKNSLLASKNPEFDDEGLYFSSSPSFHSFHVAIWLCFSLLIRTSTWQVRRRAFFSLQFYSDKFPFPLYS